MALSEVLRKELETLVRESAVVLFMKGNRTMPQCGFSASVVGMLDELLPSYKTVDVLASPEIRDGIKEFSNWPTIPQLYVKGEFVGGADIVRELHAAGELQKLLGVTVEPVKTPTITLTARAAKAITEARESPDDLLRLEIGPRFNYDLSFGPRAPNDIEVRSGEVVLLLDPSSARRADGLSINFVDGAGGGGFKIENPNEPAKVKPLSPQELKTRLDEKTITLFDVRGDRERAIAIIAGAHALDGEGKQLLESLEKNAPIAFHCHHGVRSQAAAESVLAQGFKNVFNVQGGIDAWSRIVDPKVARY